MTNCRAPPKKVQAEPLASHGDISSNPRKQYANGEAGVREEPMLRKHPGGGASFNGRLTNDRELGRVVRGDTSMIEASFRRCLMGEKINGTVMR